MGTCGRYVVQWQERKMTYQKIFDLKFREEISTLELGKRFPKERKKISRIALLELPNSLLRKLVKHEREFKKLLMLKQWLLEKRNLRKKK